MKYKDVGQGLAPAEKGRNEHARSLHICKIKLYCELCGILIAYKYVKRINRNEKENFLYFISDFVAKMAHKAGVRVILNPAPVTELPLGLLENTYVFILNETEAEFITGVCPDTDENRKKCINILKERVKFNFDVCSENGGDVSDS